MYEVRPHGYHWWWFRGLRIKYFSRLSVHLTLRYCFQAQVFWNTANYRFSPLSNSQVHQELSVLVCRHLLTTLGFSTSWFQTFKIHGLSLIVSTCTWFWKFYYIPCSTGRLWIFWWEQVNGVFILSDTQTDKRGCIELCRCVHTALGQTPTQIPFEFCTNLSVSAVYNLRIPFNLSLLMSNPKSNLSRWKSTCKAWIWITVKLQNW